MLMTTIRVAQKPAAPNADGNLSERNADNAIYCFRGTGIDIVSERRISLGRIGECKRGGGVGRVDL